MLLLLLLKQSNSSTSPFTCPTTLKESNNLGLITNVDNLAENIHSNHKFPFGEYLLKIFNPEGPISFTIRDIQIHFPNLSDKTLFACESIFISHEI